MSTTEPTVPYGFCHCGCGAKTELSPKNHTANGYVVGQPRRYVRGHSTRLRVSDLYAVTDCGYETPCWVWQRKTDGGYPRIRRDGRMQQAHRVFYVERYGDPLPSGHAVELHHRCENKLCVNPEHLEPMTGTDHRRMHVSGTTWEIVREIRRRYVPYEVTRRALADEFGLSIKQVTRIVAGQTWREREESNA